MATFTYSASASFGASKTGYMGSVGYKVLDGTGTQQIARTTSGITERQDVNSAGTGVYEALITLNSAWGSARIIWDITGVSGALAEDTVNTGQVFLDGSIATCTTDVLANATALAAIEAQTNLIPAQPAAVGSTVNLNLNQAIPLTNTAQTVGDALNAARAQGFGAWALIGSTFVLYGPDGVTPVRTFTLNSPSTPTERT